jgi:hypothetical protein
MHRQKFSTFPHWNAFPVGAAAGCELLILFLKQDQKIAAFGSSYRDGGIGEVNVCA